MFRIRLSLTVIASLLCAYFLYPQNFNWEWQNPKPTGADYNHALILSPSKYFLFGNGGAVSISTNNGSTWEVAYVDPQERNINDADFTDELTGWIAGYSGLIMKTTDGGLTWVEKSSGITQTLYGIDFIGNFGIAVGSAGTLIKSTDGGETWTSSNYGTTTLYDIHFINETTAYLAGSSATTGRLLKTTDAGATWIDISSLLPGISGTVRSISFPSVNVGFICTSVGTIYKTANAGSSWTQSYFIGTTANIINSINFADTLFGAAATINGRVILTTDGGTNWSLIQTSLTKTLYSVSTVQQVVNNSLLNNSVLIGGDSGTIILSGDNGSTWNLGFTAASQEQLQRGSFPSANVGYVVGGSISTGNSFGDLLKTTDGGNSWVKLPFQTDYRIYSVFFLNEQLGYVGSQGPSGLYRTTDGGQNWTSINTGTGVTSSILYDIDFINPDTGFVCYASSQVARTTNGGATWSSISPGWSSAAVYDMFIVSTSSIYILGPGGRISRSTDGGNNFSQLTSLGTTTLYSLYFVSADTGFIAASSGKIFKTVDGLNFNEITSPVTTTNYVIRFLNGQIGWLGSSGGNVYYTTDGGNSWTKASVSLGYAPSIRDIQIKDDKLWLIGTDGLIIRGYADPLIPVELVSFNAMLTGSTVNLNWATATEINNNGFEIERSNENKVWQKIAFIKGKGTTTEMTFYHYEDNNVAAGKHFYRLKQIDFEGAINYSQEVEVNVGTQMQYALDQNFPNPFNPVTVISWQLPVSSHVSLKVYDLLGNEVAVLVDDIKPMGRYEVKFDAATAGGGLASGMYIYKLQAGNYNKVRKMILLK